MLSFQRMDVYRCSIDFLALCTQLGQTVPRGHAPLLDQMRRASLSIPLNIAEGAGRMSAADSARCYAIARGSAMECAATVDALHILEVLDDGGHAKACELLGRIVAMLTKLCRAST